MRLSTQRSKTCVYNYVNTKQYLYVCKRGLFESGLSFHLGIRYDGMFRHCQVKSGLNKVEGLEKGLVGPILKRGRGKLALFPPFCQ